MNILNRYTIKNLRKNKTRTIVTIIGVILSTAMFSAVTIFASSLLNYVTELTKESTGAFHGAGYGVESSKLPGLRDNSKLKDSNILTDLGYSKLEGCSNESKPYLHVEGMEAGKTNLLPIHLTEGKMPVKGTEILIPNHLKTNGGITYHIGDTITCELGYRVDNDGVMLSVGDSYDGSSEKLEMQETRTYQVVGFYKRPGMEPYQSPGYTALTIRNPETDEGYVSALYMEMKTPKDIYDFMDKNKEAFTQGTDANTDLLRCLGSSNENSFNKVLTGMCAIFIGIIMLASISLIYNAFSISVGERIQQFGLISSIGATKRQLTRSVLFEALSLSVIGIPLGLLAGVGGMSITMFCLKDSFATMVEAAGDVDLVLGVHLEPWCLLVAAAIGLVTVLISALIPAKRATRVSAIDAIRQTSDIKIKARKVRTSKLTYKFFGLEGMIASKNFKRNRKKYRATVISLFITIVLFITASSFCSYLKDSAGDVITRANYDVSFSMPEKEIESESGKELPDEMEVYQRMLQCEHITKAGYMVTNALRIEVPEADLSKQYKKDILEKTDSGLQYDKNTKSYFTDTPVVFVDDELYKEYIEDLNLSPDEYMNPDKPKAVIYNNVMVFFDSKYHQSVFYKTGAEKADCYLTKPQEGYDYCSLQIDDHAKRIVEYSKDDSEETKIVDFEDAFEKNTFELGACVKDVPMGVPAKTMLATPVLLFPVNAIPQVLKGYTDGNYSSFNFKSDNHKKLAEDLGKIAEGYGISTGYIMDAKQEGEGTEAILLVINIFSYGFIGLISLISVANVFNTISTNISLRRREFAMLRTVGMTNRGFNKMMNYECLLYGCKGLIYGLPVSILTTYFLVYRTITEGIEKGFYIPAQSIIIAIASVFIVVFATMLYAMRKIKQENTIDALRNDNI